MYDASETNGSAHNTFIPVSKPMQVDNVPPGQLPLDTTLLYGSCLSAKLRDKVESYRKAGVSLVEEVAVTRVICGEAIEKWTQAMELADSADLSPAQRVTISSAAMSYVQSALNNVRDMVLAAHRVLSKESVDPMMVQAIIFQVVKLFDVELQRDAGRLRAAGIDPQELLDRLTNTIDAGVGVGFSEQGSLGTSLTADQLDEEVTEMLGTVPEVRSA